MSKLSNINNSANSQIQICVANASPRVISECTNLSPNSLIIAAEPNEQNVDTGVYAMFITDYKCTPVRLSYTIQCGNGLYFKDDTLSLNIDNNTIIENNNTLFCDVTKLIDNKSIIYDGKLLKIESDKINVASNDSIGLVKIDNDTVFINGDNTIDVDTKNLLCASYSTPGICKSDNNTISIDNGVVSVNTENLSKSSSTNYGISKCDNNTIKCTNDKIYVNTANLNVCNLSGVCGIILGSDTIEANDGVISINVDKLKHASNSQYGITKFNTDEFDINNGMVSVKNYNKTIDYIQQCNDKIETINALLKK